MKPGHEKREADEAVIDEAFDLLHETRASAQREDWALDEAPDSVAFEDSVAWQRRRLLERLESRAAAVVDVRSRLQDLWPALERTALKWLGSAIGESWWCDGQGSGVVGNPIGGMCRWCCRGCCGGGLRFLATLRARVPSSRVEAERAEAVEDGVAGQVASGAVHRKDGVLRESVRKILEALPGPAEPAQPMSWDQIASGIGLSPKTVRRWSKPMQDAGLILSDSEGTWRQAK
ncbi:MAG: hypothetical protein NXI31_26380 [bacterium]|nr:hypothetical protein [bacterium]